MRNQHSQFIDYGAIKTDMKPPLAHGIMARRQLNMSAMFLATAVPWGLFLLTSLMMTYTYYQQSAIAISVVSGCFSVAVVMGAWGVYSMRLQMRSGQQTWHLRMAASGLVACVLGTFFGCINLQLNSQTYYDYMSLRKVAGVEPGAWQGQQALDAGEVDFKNGTHVDRTMHFLWHKTQTYCVAPLVPEAGDKLASYDFWAVGVDCCSAKPGDFSCGGITYTSWTGQQEAAKGLNVCADDLHEGDRVALLMECPPHSGVLGCARHVMEDNAVCLLGLEISSYIVIHRRHRDRSCPSDHQDTIEWPVLLSAKPFSQTPHRDRFQLDPQQ